MPSFLMPPPSVTPVPSAIPPVIDRSVREEPLPASTVKIRKVAALGSRSTVTDDPCPEIVMLAVRSGSGDYQHDGAVQAREIDLLGASCVVRGGDGRAKRPGAGVIQVRHDRGHGAFLQALELGDRPGRGFGTARHGFFRPSPRKRSTENTISDLLCCEHGVAAADGLRAARTVPMRSAEVPVVRTMFRSAASCREGSDRAALLTGRL